MTSNNRFRHYARRTLSMLCLGATLGTATAGEPASIPVVCANRDLQLVTLVEAHGQGNSVAPQMVADAFFVVMQARVACSEGRVRDAVALYDGIEFTPAAPRSAMHRSTQ